MSKSNQCEGCGGRTTGPSKCRTCKSKLHHAYKRIETEGLIVDTAGTGAWWVWSKAGEVLVIGKTTRTAAIWALALGEAAEEDESEADP